MTKSESMKEEVVRRRGSLFVTAGDVKVQQLEPTHNIDLYEEIAYSNDGGKTWFLIGSAK
jgi:hypothetical protein